MRNVLVPIILVKQKKYFSIQLCRGGFESRELLIFLPPAIFPPSSQLTVDSALLLTGHTALFSAVHNSLRSIMNRECVPYGCQFFLTVCLETSLLQYGMGSHKKTKRGRCSEVLCTLLYYVIVHSIVMNCTTLHCSGLHSVDNLE